MRGAAAWTMPHAVWGVGQLQRPVLVGVHHKTGTKWMRYIFRVLSATLKQSGAPNRVRFEVRSRFKEEDLAQDFRGFHLIRDPRDIVLSGLHYHKKADERWLLAPQERFGGLNYQQKLNSIADEEGQFLFELQHQGKETVFDELLAWRYDDPRFYEARYEQLVVDAKAAKFTQILMFLGFEGRLLNLGIELFLGTVLVPGTEIPKDHVHVRDGRPEQWRTAYRRWHGERFVEVMGDALIRLGYERDNSWVERLPV
jgi:hypothetical protein